MSNVHSFTMPDWATQRVLARQGCALAHADVPPERTALIVVDMQNYFMDPASGASVPKSREIVGTINALAAALRARGGRIVWIRTLYTEEAELTIPHFHHALMAPEKYARRCEALARDAEGSRIWPELDARPEDLVVEKTRYSAFVQGASALDQILRALDIRAIWVAGTMTNACCESTARDAMMLNYRTTMVSDANASIRDDEHAAALINFYLFFGDVASSEELGARLARG
ncbi:MAG: cysteine hydrolase [Rhodovulum sulfidophilum]|uniref:Cysteine hydrolase n=1 Tax=Rhodovulum sulfidophilum TaxID=35806 RepID=A0A2W5N3Z5_RHOSU|nr:MAG: cysteine hydrolase [Rhodovulum sulfidophilum]